jgi:hypothetical protein
MLFARTTFRVRRFVTAVLALSFFSAAVSGIVLFLRPEGSLARWTGWSVFGLDKRQWEAVHILVVLILLLVSVAHAWLNWRPLVASVSGLATARPGKRWRPSIAAEFGVAVGAMLFAVSAAIVPWQPVTYLVGLRSLIKDGGLAARVPPPVPDADRLTFTQICRVLAVDEQRAMSNARAHGINIQESSETIARIASRHGVTPEEVCGALPDD